MNIIKLSNKYKNIISHRNRIQQLLKNIKFWVIIIERVLCSGGGLYERDNIKR